MGQLEQESYDMESVASNSQGDTVYVIHVPCINTNDIHYVNNYMYKYH